MGNLSAFMRKEFKTETIVEIEGFDRFKDEKGNVLPFKVKKLSYEKINQIRDFHSIEKVAYDKKTRKPVVVDGIVAKDIKYDNDKANANIVVEALVYPNLKDKELMAFYDCDEYIQMPSKLFTPIEYVELMRRIWLVLGLISPDDDEEDNRKGQSAPEDENPEITEIKNS